jgi:hypothetical protein
MMPVQLDATWIPFVSYSIFKFGSPVDEFVRDGLGTLTPQESEALSRPPPSVRANYYCEDLDALVKVLDGEIHQISAQSACLYRGHNIVGCHADVALDILGNPPVDWIDECGEGLERFGHVESLGLILEVPTRTRAVAGVILRQHPEDHEIREKRAISAASSYEQRARLRRKWPSPFTAANDVGPSS